MDIRLCCVEAGEGFPLVLLHGNGEDHTYFKRQMGPFSQRFRVIAVDTRGHGESPRGTAPFTLEQFAEDLKEFLDGRSITRCHLLGFSDGGNIALLFALKYPEYVEKLILNGADLCPSGVKLHHPAAHRAGLGNVPGASPVQPEGQGELGDAGPDGDPAPHPHGGACPAPYARLGGGRGAGHDPGGPYPGHRRRHPGQPAGHPARGPLRGSAELADLQSPRAGFPAGRRTDPVGIGKERQRWMIGSRWSGSMRIRTSSVSTATVEETHCYLLRGRERSLLIDTGLGICDIRQTVDRLTDRPVAAVATHIHWDHIGGHRYFPEFYAHEAELNWLSGGFPLSVEAVRAMVADRCCLPEDFDVSRYTLFQGHPARVLRDGDRIELGGRTLEVLHTPGHSPGHMCFWEAERGYLFSGDLVYRGTLFACYPSTNPEEYLSSLERTACLPMERLLPAHHALDIGPELLGRVRDAFRGLKEQGKLRHGGGTFDYGEWAVRL